MFRMTYKEEGKERTIFDDTVIIFTSTNGALTPEVHHWKKHTQQKLQYDSLQSPGAGGGSNKPLRGSLGDLLEGGTRIPAFVSNLDKVFQKIRNMIVKIKPRSGFGNDEQPVPHCGLASHHRARSGRGSGLQFFIFLFLFIFK